VGYLFYRAAREGWAAEAMLAEINTVLNEKLPTGNYMAITLIEVAADRQSCRIWNSGLPDAILRQPDGSLHSVASDGVPLGVLGDDSMLAQAETFAVAAGARWYVFTDGVTEMADPQGLMLSIDGVRGFLASFDPDRQSLEDFHAFLHTYRGGGGFDDDLTFIELSIA
jgi:serine phosphatase RsbU (regulator of sigma subunit)